MKRCIVIKMDKLKAYVVYPGDYPAEMGCALIFAYNRNEAKVMGMRDCDWNVEYIELKTRRVLHMDEHAPNSPTVIHTNDELPEGVDYYADEIEYE